MKNTEGSPLHPNRSVEGDQDSGVRLVDIATALLGEVQSARAEYEERSRIYLECAGLTIASGIGHADGQLALARSIAAHRRLHEAVDRYRAALREFTAVVVYRR